MLICLAFLHFSCEWPGAVLSWRLYWEEMWSQSRREYPLGSHEELDLLEHVEILLEQGRVQGCWLPIIARPVKRIQYNESLFIIIPHDLNPVLIILIREIHEHVLLACFPIYEWPLFQPNSNGLSLDLVCLRVELAEPDDQLFYSEVFSALFGGELSFD
jgi:hypothetical protein